MILQSLTWFLIALCPSALYASTGRVLQLSGFLVTLDKSKAVIKDDKGLMKVPSASVDAEHTKIGQWIVVNVDFLDFYRMNPDKFKDLQK